MTDRDPVRLVDDPSTSDAVREALATVDAPPAYNAAAAARAVELAAAKATGAAVTVAPWTKVAVVLVCGVAVVAGTYAATRSPSRAAAPVAIERPSEPRAARTLEPRVEPAPEVVVATQDASVDGVDASAAVVRAARGSTASRAAEERDLLAEAQRALERESDPRRAAALVAQHRRRFARSSLEEERSYLEFRARTRLGDAAEARRVGAAFVARFGGGIYGGPARRLLEALR